MSEESEALHEIQVTVRDIQRAVNACEVHMSKQDLEIKQIETETKQIEMVLKGDGRDIGIVGRVEVIWRTYQFAYGLLGLVIGYFLRGVIE